MQRVNFLILLVPSLGVLLFTTSDRPSQLFFSAFTAINAFYLVSIIAHFVLGADGEPIWADALLRLALFGLIIFVFVRYLRQAYRFIAVNMKRDWRVMAVIPFLFFALVMFLGLYPQKRTDNLLGVVFLYVILCVVYYVIYQVFNNTYQRLRATSENDALKSQVTALQRQADAVRRSEERIPLSSEPGHGLGSRSIAAFMKKHDAIYSYKLKDGMFRLQFLINRSK